MSRSFPTSRRIVRREIVPDSCPSTEELEKWVKSRGVQIGPALPDDPSWRRKVLCGLWTWRDLDAQELRDVPETDLIRHRVKVREGVVPYASRTNRRLSGYWE